MGDEKKKSGKNERKAKNLISKVNVNVKSFLKVSRMQNKQQHKNEKMENHDCRISHFF